MEVILIGLMVAYLVNIRNIDKVYDNIERKFDELDEIIKRDYQ